MSVSSLTCQYGTYIAIYTFLGDFSKLILTLTHFHSTHMHMLMNMTGILVKVVLLLVIEL